MNKKWLMGGAVCVLGALAYLAEWMTPDMDKRGIMRAFAILFVAGACWCFYKAFKRPKNLLCGTPEHMEEIRQVAKEQDEAIERREKERAEYWAKQDHFNALFESAKTCELKEQWPEATALYDEILLYAQKYPELSIVLYLMYKRKAVSQIKGGDLLGARDSYRAALTNIDDALSAEKLTPDRAVAEKGPLERALIKLEKKITQ